ncbi:MAG: DegT/DnrJ/EryC1/StrS family aminotransferase [Candidatus Latescibacterota bacterium]|nr:DegT/DnrJ/EryC1/StrS family aminotransferase [Candidatus Latescibacterota bacterium]
MYRIGEAEVRRIRKLIESGRIFRYGQGGECDRFEQDWAAHVGVRYARMARNGTSAIYTALVGLGVGPGDQVIVPAYTYMATALAVLAAGAIPVIADVDDSLTLSPADVERRITVHTKAIIPVHMVGLPCDMMRLMRIARKHKLFVVEDACQAVGGGFRGKMLGAIGDAGAYSFNFFKNITCGEGGAFVTNRRAVYDRGSVAVDCCSFYWNPDQEREELQFAGHNFRASEFEGAILNAQLSRLEPMMKKMRRQKQRLTSAGEKAGLRSIVNHSIDHECGTHAGFLFDTEKQARAFAGSLAQQKVSCFLPMDTGRHVYTRWEPIMRKQGAHHVALDPFKIPANRKAKIRYTQKMCAASLDVLSRAVLVPTHPDHKVDDVRRMIAAIKAAA